MSLTLELVAQTLISQSSSVALFKDSDDAFKDSGQPNKNLLIATSISSPETPISSKKNIKKMNPQLPLNCEQTRIECSINHVSAESKEKIESFQLIEIKAENQVTLVSLSPKPLTNLQHSLMANADLAPPELPKQEIHTENSSVENQSVIPVKEIVDLGKLSLIANNGLEPPKKLPVQDIPPSGASHQENSSQENTLVKQTVDAQDHSEAGAKSVEDTVGLRRHHVGANYNLYKEVFDNLFKNKSLRNDQLKVERAELLTQITVLELSLHNLVILYDAAKAYCKKADVDKEKVLRQ